MLTYYTNLLYDGWSHRFKEAVAVSLANGIADSFAGAGMYTITSYLDLFTGILILWYCYHA